MNISKQLLISTLLIVGVGGCKNQTEKQVIYRSTYIENKGDTVVLESKNPLETLHKGNVFDMKYGTDVLRFTVKGKYSGGLSVTTDQWLYTENLALSYSDYDPNFYKLIK